VHAEVAGAVVKGGPMNVDEVERRISSTPGFDAFAGIVAGQR
jgi:hypothetical protein